MATNLTKIPKPLVLRLRMTEARTKLVREILTDMIKLRLQQITQANGYLTDYGLKVHHGQAIIAEPELGSLNFWDNAVTAVKAGSGLQENTLSLVIHAYDKRDEADLQDGQNPDELIPPLVNVASDLERAMLRNHVTGAYDPEFDGIAKSCTFLGSQIVTGLFGALWLEAETSFSLVYNTRLGDPFQQTAIAQ